MTRVAAPMRLDFAGGWTDVPPFADREGGLVVNAAVDLRVEAEFAPGGEGILLQADDLGEIVRVRGARDLVLNGTLDLHKAALRMFPAGPGTLRTRSAAPPGSGLGSSGALDVALKDINKQRADLGAYQNRLEYAVKGLDVGAENMQAAESRIRDADMASEMAEYTKNAIITQSATAMLAQANAKPRTVLQLLQ